MRLTQQVFEISFFFQYIINFRSVLLPPALYWWRFKQTIYIASSLSTLRASICPTIHLLKHLICGTGHA